MAGTECVDGERERHAIGLVLHAVGVPDPTLGVGVSAVFGGHAADQSGL